MHYKNAAHALILSTLMLSQLSCAAVGNKNLSASASTNDSQDEAQPETVLVKGRIIVTNENEDPSADLARWALETETCTIELNVSLHYLIPQAGQNYHKKVTIEGFYWKDTLNKPICERLLVATNIIPEQQ